MYPYTSAICIFRSLFACLCSLRFIMIATVLSRSYYSFSYSMMLCGPASASQLRQNLCCCSGCSYHSHVCLFTALLWFGCGDGRNLASQIVQWERSSFSPSGAFVQRDSLTSSLNRNGKEGDQRLEEREREWKSTCLVISCVVFPQGTWQSFETRLNPDHLFSSTASCPPPLRYNFLFTKIITPVA